MRYIPGEEWEARPAAALGLSPQALPAAAEYHRVNESAWPRDFITPDGRYLGVADEPRTSEVLGPVRPRGGPNGIVLREGYIVAEWGDTARADMTFSVAKSYLALLAGLAVLWWLNTGRIQMPSAPASSFSARGAGSNVIWIDPDHDLVAVVRWIDKASFDGFVKLVLEGLR